MKIMLIIGLLELLNKIMTLVWYGHLKFSELERFSKSRYKFHHLL